MNNAPRTNTKFGDWLLITIYVANVKSTGWLAAQAHCGE
jgi:hypothetical protein